MVVFRVERGRLEQFNFLLDFPLLLLDIGDQSVLVIHVFLLPQYVL
jgi:hypothetical protein